MDAALLFIIANPAKQLVLVSEFDFCQLAEHKNECELLAQLKLLMHQLYWPHYTEAMQKLQIGPQSNFLQ